MIALRQKPQASDRLLETAARYSRLVVMTHNNPDPDAIASGWALLQLFEQVLKRPALLTGGGEVIRAENRTLVSLLSPPLQLNAPLDLDSETLLVLVDCDVDSTNHPRIDTERVAVAVLDHH